MKKAIVISIILISTVVMAEVLTSNIDRRLDRLGIISVSKLYETDSGAVNVIIVAKSKGPMIVGTALAYISGVVITEMGSTYSEYSAVGVRLPELDQNWGATVYDLKICVEKANNGADKYEVGTCVMDAWVLLN